MLPAVCLHDQSQAEMNEVHDVGPQGLLAAELLAFHAVGAQVAPEQLFGVGHVLAQGFGELALVHGWGPLSPGPSPARGEGSKTKASIVRLGTSFGTM